MLTGKHPTLYNRGIEILGDNVVRSVLDTASKYYKGISFVSVGSGSAMIEHTLPDIDWILVDPEPESFMRPGEVPYMMPHYKYTRDIDRTDIVGNCVVFLNWCDPSEPTGYDLQAIRLLDPIAIIVVMEVCEPDGAAGTKDFHQWRRNQRYYSMVHSVTLDVEIEEFKEMDVRMCWYAKTLPPMEVTADLPARVPPRASISSNIMEVCVIS